VFSQIEPQQGMTTKEYRRRHAIISEILNTINDSEVKGVSKTSIMYKSFLSYTQLTEYLCLFVRRGLINELKLESRTSRNEKSVYKITEKGLRLLQISQEIERMMGLH
jgi:predicted transcriptional regulator